MVRTRRHRHPATTVVVVLVVAVGALGAHGAPPARAAPEPGARAAAKAVTRPCALLKAADVSAGFDGASVGAPTPGATTAVSVECTWPVAAGPALPAGTVSARVMTVGAKAAYRGLEQMAGLTRVAGRKDTLAMPSTGAVMTLTGSRLVTVQGVFLTGVPVRVVDVQDRLLALLADAVKRV